MRNELRALLTSLLEQWATTYYKIADDENLYPHIVFYFYNMDFPETKDNYFRIRIGIWERDEVEVNRIASEITKYFDGLNYPTESILPTFYVDSTDESENKNGISNINIDLIASTYERNVIL